MQTTIEVLQEQVEKCRELAGVNRHDMPGAGREFSLAATALEEAMMRFNRGMSHLTGTFKTADLEKIRA